MRVVGLVLLVLGIAACQSQESADYATLDDTSVTTADVDAELLGCSNANECDDGLFCTTDSCVGGVCGWKVVPYFCAIDGVCVPKKEFEPGNNCAWCNPESSETVWSPFGSFESGGMRCIDGKECHFLELCKEKKCGDDGCGALCNYVECDDARGEQ